MDFKQRGQDIETASWLNENKGGKLAKKCKLAKWRALPPASKKVTAMLDNGFVFIAWYTLYISFYKMQQKF